MSNQLSWSDAVSMNEIIEKVGQDGGEASTADLTAEGSGGMSLNEADDSTSQMYSAESKTFEENLHSINAAIERIKQSMKSKKIASIDETMTTGCQIENLKNIFELMNRNEIDIDCRGFSDNKTKEQASDLQKEVIRLNAELAAKDEKIRSLETILESNKTAMCAMCEAPVRKDKLEVFELQRQVIRLEVELSARWEQIATLRAMLKSSEDDAEAKLNDLKSKYEDENAIVDETMLILRNQLRELKECTAAFSSLRAMFVAHCEESAAREDELKRQLFAAEEHRKALSLLLRPVAQQKLSLPWWKNFNENLLKMW